MASKPLFLAYFVFDRSQSMSLVETQLNDLVRELIDGLAASPEAAARSRLAVTSFASDFRVDLDLADAQEVTSVPTMVTAGSTNYAAAFGGLADRIPDDVARFASQGFQIYRPSIFLITDGEPDQGWETDFDRLVGPEARVRPNIVVFGFGDVRAETILTVATRPEWAFVAKPEAGHAEALSKILPSLYRSMVDGAQGELLPEVPEGFVSALDFVA